MIRARVLLVVSALAACDGSLRFDEPDGSVVTPPVAPACASGNDCPSATPYCSAAGRCVQCLDSRDCPYDLACEHVLGQCNARCHDEPDCPATTPTCDEEHGVCAFCTSSDICAADEPVCNLVTGLCTKCSADSQCPPGRPRCDTSGACVHCETNADCPTGARCDLGLHDCV
jgi:hypothetical protein